MKKLFFAFLVLVAASASAQNGITNEFRFGQGEDSIRCLEAISISSINVKNKDFNTAYSAWKIVFTEFPVARVDTYTNGIKILTELIKTESDPAKKEEYIKELMLVYDNQIKYINKLQEITKTRLSAGNILGRKAMAYITKEDVVKKLFDEIAPKYADRNGGYCRITKLGPRRGDCAEMAIIELV